VKIRAERGRNRAAPGYAQVAADAKAGRVARQLKIFLEKTSRNRMPDSRRQRPPISFDEVLTPAVSFAVARLRRNVSRAAQKLLANSAWDDLRQHVSARLAFALTPTLRLQQTAAKAVARSLVSIGQNGERRRALQEDITLLEAIAEFPDLLETTAQLISAWIDAQGELFARLLRDKGDLCSVFLRGRECLRVTHIRPGLSDPHDGGRTATTVEFVGHRRVIYKPRSSDREALWFEALRWLNRNGVHVSFRVPTMLPRQNYVWMEFLQTNGCKSPSAVRSFYFRWGAQAALAQILRATDLHRDNWLGVGAQPILVDAELIGDAEPASPRGKLSSKHRQSLPVILQTGLLPLTSRDRAGFYRGIAPFDATIPKSAPPKCWPRYGHTVQEPSRHVNDLVRGFDTVAGLLGCPQTAQKFFRQIVLRTGRQECRVLLRATARYQRLLRESCEARNMVSIGERWRRLVRECCDTATNRRVGLAEARALLRCDIPKFTKRPRAVSASWKQFSIAVAELKGSSRLLRRRVLLETRGRRGRKKRNG
jgi:lantibiotic modifying enzyme